MLFGVEFGGGESKDLRLHFGTYPMNFRFTTLASAITIPSWPTTSTALRPPFHRKLAEGDPAAPNCGAETRLYLRLAEGAWNSRS
jgi:hypothetical protein